MSLLNPRSFSWTMGSIGPLLAAHITLCFTRFWHCWLKKGIGYQNIQAPFPFLTGEFVKKGIFDKELSSWLQGAFDLRQRADYRELFTVSPERAGKILSQARTFVNEVKTAIAIQTLGDPV
jgi:hypothetical protein